MSKDKDSHIYYNISYLNNGSQPKVISLNENRNDPLLNNPKLYHLSVVRFTLATSYIPIFIFESAGSNLPNNAYYAVTINNTTKYVQYVPANTLTSADDEYLFVYSYQAFLDMINEAFRQAFITAAPAGCTQPPYLVYESDTQLFCLVAEIAYVTNNHKIYMNQFLYSFFDNFNIIRYGYSLVSQKDVEFRIGNIGGNVVTLHAPGYPSVPAGAYKMCQEYNSVYNWNDAKSVVFLTNTISVVSEALNVRNSESTSQGDDYRKMLTDFEFNVTPGTTSTSSLRSYIQYHSVGEYRLLDMQDNSPMYKFDLQIMFQTKSLRLYPLKLLPTESLSIKIMFRKK